jgi:hypothetical protein
MKREELIRELQPYASTMQLNLVKSLLAADIQVLREKNDTATADVFLQNQGAIQWLKKLLKDLSTEKSDKAVFDGGFGE